MPKVRVDVTADDIKHYPQISAQFGAVPMAIARVIPARPLVTVTFRHITFIYPGARETEIPTPDLVVEWLRHHDETGEGKPFSFELDVPEAPG